MPKSKPSQHMLKGWFVAGRKSWRLARVLAALPVVGTHFLRALDDFLRALLIRLYVGLRSANGTEHRRWRDRLGIARQSRLQLLSLLHLLLHPPLHLLGLLPDLVYSPLGLLIVLPLQRAHLHVTEAPVPVIAASSIARLRRGDDHGANAAGQRCRASG
jgi:hypothetical protein